MKKVMINSKIYLLIEVPDNAYSFREKVFNSGGHFIMFEPRVQPHLFLQSIKLGRTKKSDKFKIVGLISDIIKDEKICHTLALNELKSLGYIYLDCLQPDSEKRPYKLDKASDSFISYLKFIKTDLSKQYVLIQKI